MDIKVEKTITIVIKPEDNKMFLEMLSWARTYLYEIEDRMESEQHIKDNWGENIEAYKKYYNKFIEQINS